jgi:hypothetical protein
VDQGVTAQFALPATFGEGRKVTESDREYFERRAEEERAAAKNAAHPFAKSAHLEMAERYEDLAAAIARTELGVVVPLHAA